MLITFEGLDYSGKSTQVQLLVDYLRKAGHDVLLVREPGGTRIGEAIRAMLLDKDHTSMTDIAEVFLFSASRAQLVREVIRPAIEAGTIVICDRFYDSTTAYQGWGRQIPLDAIEAINRTATGGLIPSVTFFLDVPLDELEKRRKPGKTGKDRIELNGEEFYERVRRGYYAIADKEQRMVVLDGMKPIRELEAVIRGLIQSRLGTRNKVSEKE